jgi:hypothetical protein
MYFTVFGRYETDGEFKQSNGNSIEKVTNWAGKNKNR